MAAKKQTYEQAIEELESIVEKLESGQLPLEDSIKAYERGMALSKHLEGLLGDAQRRVTLLTEQGEQISFEEEVES